MPSIKLHLPTDPTLLPIILTFTCVIVAICGVWVDVSLCSLLYYNITDGATETNVQSFNSHYGVISGCDVALGWLLRLDLNWMSVFVLQYILSSRLEVVRESPVAALNESVCLCVCLCVF